MGLAMTIGDKRENYGKGQPVGFSVEELITPFKASMNHVGVTTLPHYAVFGASFQASDEEIDRSAAAYIQYIKAFK